MRAVFCSVYEKIPFKQHTVCIFGRNFLLRRRRRLVALLDGKRTLEFAKRLRFTLFAF